MTKQARIGDLLWISPPDKVVVNETAEIKGVINKARAGLQGKGFWKDQLRTIKSELQWELSEPQREAEFEKNMEELYRELNKDMEEIYRKNPERSPSSTERRAKFLRERADQIEQAEIDREFE